MVVVVMTMVEVVVVVVWGMGVGGGGGFRVIFHWIFLPVLITFLAVLTPSRLTPDSLTVNA